MKRIHTQSVLALFSAALLALPSVAQTREQAPPKEHPKPEQAKEAPKESAKDVAKKAAHFETIHRHRIARIDRLIAIYTKKGDTAKVAELKALREAQQKRHDNAVANFRKQLGDEKYAKLEKEIKGANERARAKRNEHANENEREHEARKAEKEGKPEEKSKGEHSKDKPKDKN